MGLNAANKEEPSVVNFRCFRSAVAFYVQKSSKDSHQVLSEGMKLNIISKSLEKRTLHGSSIFVKDLHMNFGDI